MKEIIEEILSLWGIEKKQLLQIHPSAWEINHSYVIKIYDNKKQLERNIKIMTVLSDCNIPVAEKSAVPCVMECIEILCAAYFISIKDTKHAIDAYDIFHFVQNCENDILNAIGCKKCKRNSNPYD